MDRRLLGWSSGSVALVSALWAGACGGGKINVGSSTGTGSGGATTSAQTGGGGPATGPTSSTSSSSSSGGACAPMAGDDACALCAKQMCCSDVTACAADGKCGCWVLCLQQNPGNDNMCLAACGVPDQTTQMLSACADGPCVSKCAGSGASSSSSATGASASSSSGGLCAPMPGDTACDTCSKASCCSQVTACAADVTCICWVNCIKNNGTLQSCALPTSMGGCGAESAATQGLFLCTLTNCSGQCP